MNIEEKDRLGQTLERFLNENLERILLSNAREPWKLERVRLRPLLLKGELVFQRRSRWENRLSTGILAEMRLFPM